MCNETRDVIRVFFCDMRENFELRRLERKKRKGLHRQRQFYPTKLALGTDTR